MIKAYELGFDDPEYGLIRKITFAETPGKAKYKTIWEDYFEDAEFTDLSCKRAKWADGMENLGDLEFEIEELKNGWEFWLDDGSVIDEKTIPLVKKYGGVDKFIEEYENNESIKYNYDEEEFYKNTSK